MVENSPGRSNLCEQQGQAAGSASQLEHTPSALNGFLDVELFGGDHQLSSRRIGRGGDVFSRRKQKIVKLRIFVKTGFGRQRRCFTNVPGTSRMVGKVFEM